MTPQSLKSAILQLAIQGKLVPQRPEDGVARVPAALNTEQRKARRHGKEMEPPFEIPGNWRWVRLGQLFDIARGGSPRPIKAFLTTEENGLNWIKIGDTDKNSKYINSCREKIIPSGLSKTRQVFKGDLLLTNSMSFGHPYILNIDGCIHDGWLVLHPASPELFKDFFFYLLSSPVVFKQFQTAAAGAVVQNLNSDKVAQTLVPLPPLPEQHRIVAKIEELLPLIDRYEQAWTQLEDFNRRFPADMQKSLLQLAIQGKLVEQRPEEGTGEQLYRKILAAKKSPPTRPSSLLASRLKSAVRRPSSKEKLLPPIAEDEIPFEIPDSWKWVRVADIWTVLNGDKGKNYPAKSTLSKTGIPFISALNLDGKTVAEDDRLLCLSEKQYDLLGNGKLIKGDIVVCIRGSLGKHGRYPFEKGAIASSLVTMRSKLQLPTLDDFLMLYLDTPLFFSEIKKFDNGTAQPNLAAKSLEQFLFPLPPIAEQKRIVAKLEELLPLCIGLEAVVTT